MKRAVGIAYARLKNFAFRAKKEGSRFIACSRTKFVVDRDFEKEQKKTMKFFALNVQPLTLFTLLSFAGCTGMMVKNTANRIDQNETYDTTRMSSLMFLKDYCRKKNLSVKEYPQCDQSTINGRIAELKRKYQVSRGIVIIPLEGKGLQQKLKAEETGYRATGTGELQKTYQFVETNNYEMCALVYNFTGKTINAIKVKIIAVDAFGTPLAEGIAISEDKNPPEEHGMALGFPYTHPAWGINSWPMSVCTQEPVQIKGEVSDLKFQLIAVR